MVCLSADVCCDQERKKGKADQRKTNFWSRRRNESFERLLIIQKKKNLSRCTDTPSCLVLWGERRKGGFPTSPGNEGEFGKDLCLSGFSMEKMCAMAGA